MANMFALILVIATLVTGLLWCLDKFVPMILILLNNREFKLTG